MQKCEIIYITYLPLFTFCLSQKNWHRSLCEISMLGSWRTPPIFRFSLFSYLHRVCSQFFVKILSVCVSKPIFFMVAMVIYGCYGNCLLLWCPFRDTRINTEPFTIDINFPNVYKMTFLLVKTGQNMAIIASKST